MKQSVALSTIVDEKERETLFHYGLLPVKFQMLKFLKRIKEMNNNNNHNRQQVKCGE
jgi:hypothetical protein